MDVILLDELSEKLDSLNGGITSTISTINENVNDVKAAVDTVNGNVVINNTPSDAGTLSQKLSFLINGLYQSVIPTMNNINNTKSTVKINTTSISGNGTFYGKGFFMHVSNSSSSSSDADYVVDGSTMLLYPRDIVIFTSSINCNRQNAKGKIIYFT